MHVLKFIFILLEVVLLFNLVILVHELGHFLAARWRGLKVERFGIWFGKPIWEKKYKDVWFSLGSIPAGGFVSLPQMAPMEAIEGKNENPREQLPPISPLDKIIVAFAGPLFSFMLALVFGVVVWMVGRPVSEQETTTTIGYVETNSPAALVGLQPGDKILAVDGHEVNRFSGVSDNSVTWRIVRSEGDTIAVKVLREGKELVLNPAPTKTQTKSYERAGLRKIGVAPAYTPMVARVIPNGPADRAGIQPNDLIQELNGRKIYHEAGFSTLLAATGPVPSVIKGLRNGQPFTATVTPEMPLEGDTIPRIGLKWDGMGQMDLVHPGPVEQVKAAVTSMVSTFGALFSSKSDIKPQHLSGPVGIMRIYYMLFQSEQGWRMALWFSVVLNVNLALLNLVPIPVLDGGHITLALVEAVRRKPLDIRILTWLQNGCAMLVIFYILYVSFYDVQDLRSPKEKPTKDLKFAPKPDTQSNPVPAPSTAR